MTLDLALLRKLAKEATPGPWAWKLGCLLADHGKRHVVIGASSHNRTPYLVARDPASGLLMEIAGDEPDMQYIAAANPAAMEELLDRLERAEDALRSSRKYLNDPYKAPELVPELIGEEIDAYFSSLELGEKE